MSPARMTVDIAADLRRMSVHDDKVALVVEAADKLDELIYHLSIAEGERDIAREKLADATVLLIEAVQHGGLPTVLRQRINGFLAEQPKASGRPITNPPGWYERQEQP